MAKTYRLTVLIFLMGFRSIVNAGSQEDDITERLKGIIQANACLQQGMREPRNSSKILVRTLFSQKT